MPGAARWLLDNRYLIRREGMAAVRELSAAAHLRYVSGGTLPEKLCACLLSSGRNTLTDERITRFLRGFQRSIILEREELAALVSALRSAIVAALEALARSLAADGEDAEADAARLVTALRELGTRDFRKLLGELPLLFGG